MPSQTPKKASKLWRLVVPMLLILMIGGAVFLVNYNRNYAAEVAAPIERELVKMGAVKKCSSGSSGREFGGSNLEPWYGASFVIEASEKQAVQILKDATNKHNYKLTKAVPGNNGNLPIADAYLEGWYFNNSVKNPYKDLEEGNVELSMSAGTSRANICTEKYRLESGQSSMGISVTLPAQKWRLY